MYIKHETEINFLHLIKFHQHHKKKTQQRKIFINISEVNIMIKTEIKRNFFLIKMGN